MDNRAVSTALSYALILGIVTLLLAGLTTGFAPLVSSQQAAATHTTLEVVGNDVASDISSVDRLAVAAGTNGTVVLRTRLPKRVGGSPYQIEIDEADGERLYAITLTSADHDTSATVQVRTRTEIDVEAIDTLDGGNLEIATDGERLVVEHV